MHAIKCHTQNHIKPFENHMCSPFKHSIASKAAVCHYLSLLKIIHAINDKNHPKIIEKKIHLDTNVNNLIHS